MSNWTASLGLGLMLCSACSTMPPRRDVLTEVKAAVAEFDGAQVSGDRATLERYLADDFVFIKGSGDVQDRKSFIESFGDPTKLDPYVITNPMHVALGNDAALIGGEAVVTGTTDGKPFSEHVRFVDVYEWRDGRWQVVYSQVTVIP